MKLADYLREHRISLQAFADMVGVTKSSAHRYLGGTIPSPAVMANIVRETGGMVTPADFYEVPEGSDGPAPEPSEAAD